MLKQVNALPYTEGGPAIGYGNRQRHRRQSRFDVSGHIIWAFGSVDDPALRGVIGWRHETREKLCHIALHVRVCIFLDEERAGRVLAV